MIPEARSGRWIFHLIVFVLLAFVGWPYFVQPQPYGLLDYFTLPFHEFGHQVAGLIFGDFFTALAGTLGQLAFPVGFTVYFFWKRDPFAGFVALFLVFQNLVNVSVYMADAKLMLLPLFGGGDDIQHDWNFLFGRMSLLRKSTEIATFVRAVATLGMAVAVGGMLWWLWTWRPRKEGEVGF